MLMLSGIMAMTILLISQTARSARHTQQETQDSQSGRVALDSMTKLLRTATSINTSPRTPAFVSAGPDDVTFYANVDTVSGGLTSLGPWRVHIYVDAPNNTLVQELTPAAPATGPSPPLPYTWNTGTTSRVLARDLVNPQPTRPTISSGQPSGGPVFTYLANGDTTASSLPTDTAGNLTSAALDNVSDVEVWLTVASDPTDAPPTSSSDRIFLPNSGDPDVTTGS